MQKNIAICILACFTLGVVTSARSQSTVNSSWITAWTAGPQEQVGELVPIVNRTVRSYVSLSVGGQQLRVRFSNEYGSKALTIGGATVGLTDSDGTLRSGTLRNVTFGGASSILVPVGAPAYSDPIDLNIPDATTLAISLYLPGEVLPETYKRRSAGQVGGPRTGAEISAEGDFTSQPQIEDATPSDYLFLTRVDVVEPQVQGVVAVMGTSRTNGPGHWPEFLNQRLNTTGPSMSVVNASLQANVLSWPYPGGGDAALARFDRDVLLLPGITHFVLADAINDIGQPGGSVIPASQLPTLENLSAVYLQFVTRARARGVKVIAATVMPFEGVPFGNFYSAEKNQLREALNQWIRSSGAFDGIIDLDAIMRDPDNPSQIRPGLHTDNNFGPNEQGERMIADAVDLRLFR